MKLSIVVAMAADGLIGRGGALPWRLPRDLKRFRSITWGKPIVMGRATHESIGRALPGRTNIVLTRRADYRAEGCLVAQDRDQALELAASTGATEAMVIGGREVYAEFLPLCELAHVTLVEGHFEGDVYFPGPLLGSPGWEIIRREDWPADGDGGPSARYLILSRRDDGDGTSGVERLESEPS